MHLYPIFLNLQSRNCLVVGGGRVAERKVATLMEYGAKISVVSPQAEESIIEYSSQGLISWKRREFQPEDLDNTFMVFIATAEQLLNKYIADLCRQKEILVNAVDDPPNCDFFVPSILRRGSLALAISTEGKSPLLAAKLRRQLEEVISPEYSEFVEILGDLRYIIKGSRLDGEERKKIFEELVNSDLLELVKAGEKDKIEELINICISSLQD